MFGDRGATPPHSCGHARRVCRCNVYMYVCVCVRAQEDHAADSWSGAQTLQREGDSEEENAGLKVYNSIPAKVVQE